MPKNAQTTTHLHLFHTLAVTLKTHQARLQQYVNCELPDVQAGFRKGRGTRDQIANISWITEKASEFKKKSTSALLTMPNREGNSNPLQYSCLENPMDGGASWATFHGVAKSRTQLSDFTFTFHFYALEKKWQPTPVFLPGESQGRGPWWAAVSRVAQSQTRLKRLNSSSTGFSRQGC